MVPPGIGGPEEADRLDLRGIEHRRRHTREEVVGGTELDIGQVVVDAGDGAQAEGDFYVWQHVNQALACRMPFGDEDLFENELEIGLDETGHGCFLDAWQSGNHTHKTPL